MAAILTIFGATGDLTKRKLMPALYNLERKRQLDENLIIKFLKEFIITNSGLRRETDTIS